MPMLRDRGGKIGDVRVVDEQPARSGREISGTDVEQRGLAGARRPEQRQKFAVRDIEIERFQRANPRE